MNELTSLDRTEQFIKDNPLSFIYFSKNDCGVCQALLPKVKHLLTLFPMIKFRVVHADEVEGIVGRFSVFAAPTLLFFVDGKEYIRESRFVHIQVLQEKISKIYHLIVSKQD